MFAYIMSRKNGWIENRNQDIRLCMFARRGPGCLYEKAQSANPSEQPLAWFRDTPEGGHLQR